MQIKKLVWLFNNLDRYEYDNEGIAIKEAFSQLLVTKDTLENDDIRNKASECYDKFIVNFYNDILGYQNGLANRNITASTLDCYFVNTSDGYIPIGLYKEQRPAETAAMVQTFLEQCKVNIKQDRNKAIAGWQNDIANISAKYNDIREKKNPSLLKAIITMFFSIPILFYGIANLINTEFYKAISFSNENANVILGNYSLLDGSGKNGLITLIIICILLITTSIVFIVNSVREVFLLCEKKNTSNVLCNIHAHVNQIENGTTAFIENNSEQCFDAARKGENIFVSKNSNANLISDVKKRIKRALDFVNKTDKARSAVGSKTISGIVIAYLLILTVMFLQLPSDNSGIMSNPDTPKINVSSEQPVQTNSEAGTDEKQEDIEPNLDIYETDDIISYSSTNSPREDVNQTPSYSTYYDSDFGFKIDYPAHFESQRVQDDITRRIYALEDGSAILKINAGYNLGNITSQQLSNKLISTYGGNVTYNPVKDTWFALSVNDSDEYHYAYYKLDEGEIRGFEFHFNGAENLDKYSKYIDHIYASFKKN